MEEATGDAAAPEGAAAQAAAVPQPMPMPMATPSPRGGTGATQVDSTEGGRKRRAADQRLQQQWERKAGPFTSKKAALKAADGIAPHQWAWNQKGGSKQWLRCNAHVDCPVFLRIQVVQGVHYVQQIGGAEHAQDSKVKRRKNSILSFEEEGRVSEALKSGTRPRQVVEKWTTETLEAAQEEGGEVTKKPGGGLAGEHLRWCGCVCCTDVVQMPLDAA